MTGPSNVSVVIPLYNKRTHVLRAIQSVFRQTIPADELIIVDDGSTDGSSELVMELQDPRIRLYRQPNAGVSAARNRGIELAVSDYIAFLDADDEWLADFLEQVVRLIRTYPDALAYATNYFISNPGTGRQIARPGDRTAGKEHWLINNYFECIAKGSNPVWSSAVCVPRKTFDEAGMFLTGISLYEDLHMWTRIALRGAIAYCGKPCSIYHRDAENRACNYIVPGKSDLEFAGLIADAIRSGRLPPPESRYARMFVAKYGLLNAFKALVAGNHGEARQIALSIQPVSLGQTFRKHFITALSAMPQTLVNRIWQIGRSAKAIRARLAGPGGQHGLSSLKTKP